MQEQKYFLAMKIFIIGFFVVLYVGGVWKFWGGFNRTNFDRGLPTKIVLGLLWPVLVFNRPYRKNFQKALRS